MESQAVRPRPIFFASAVGIPMLVIGAGAFLYEHYRHPPHDPYLCVTIILATQLTAVVLAVVLGIVGWRRGEHPYWLALAGIAISLWFLSHLAVCMVESSPCSIYGPRFLAEPGQGLGSTL